MTEEQMKEFTSRAWKHIATLNEELGRLRVERDFARQQLHEALRRLAELERST